MSAMIEPADVLAVVAKISPLLAGKSSPEQGAILAELAGRWLAGHPRKLREPLIALHMSAVTVLAEINAKQMFGGKGHPADREGPS